MGFPHSEIFGSKCAGNSPKLIAACHVLHRLSVPRHPPNALIVLDLTFCQRNDDLAIIISARSVQGTTPTHETAFLPNPSTLPRRQSEDLDFKTSSLPMNDVKERYPRRSDGAEFYAMVEADGIEPTTSCLQSRRSPN
jgi:hypothetical protein